MRKRAWTIEWRARPGPDGEARLGQAIQLLLDAAPRAGAIVDVTAARVPAEPPRPAGGEEGER
jgi:hypothetical protein